MRVKLTTCFDSESSYSSHHLEAVSTTQGTKTAYIHDLNECPEDAIIGRALFDGHDIISFIRLAHEAGRRGEPLDIEVIETKEE